MAYIEHPSPFLAVGCFAVIGAVVYGSRLARFVAPKPDRLASIDGLRGVLALCVMVHHFFIAYQWKHTGAWTPPPTHLYDLMGTCSVALFFMITGFLFFGKIKAVRGQLDLDAFFAGRAFRIIPVFAVSVTFIYAAALARTGFRLGNSLQGSLDQWMFFQSGIINGYGATNVINAGVHWTLSYEWLFYFSLPLLCWLWTRLRLQTWALGLLSVGCLWMAKAAIQIPLLDLGAGLFAPFALGGLVGEMGRSAALRRLAGSRWTALVSIGLAAFVFLFCESAYSVSGYILLALMFAPIALGNSLFGLLRTRTLMSLGEISYDIYLLHGIVIFVLFTILMPNGFETASTPGRLFSLLLMVSAGTLALSLLVHIVVERPCLRFGKRLVAIDRTQELAAP